MPRLLVASFSVCPSPDRHGVELVNLLKALVPRFDVDVMTLKVGELPIVDRFLRARMLRMPVGDGDLVTLAERFGRALRRQIEGEDYDVVHLRGAWGARAILDRIGPSTKVVYDVSEPPTGHHGVEAAAVLREEDAACMARADLVLVPSETARGHVAARLDDARVAVRLPGVDIDTYDFEPEIERAPRWLEPDARQGAPLARRTPCIVYAGRVSAGRGLRLLVAAVGKLRQKRGGDVRLVLIGPIDGDFAGPLDEAIGAAGLGDCVVRVGPIAHGDVPRVLAQATVCVAPSAPDTRRLPLAGCPTKILEYLACRRPVVAPRRPIVEEFVRDDREALLFTPGDDADLVDKLERMIDDVELAESLAEAGYRRVRSRFPAAASRRALLEAYARLVPATSWLAPSRAAEPVGAMPARIDSTTARFSIPAIVDDEYLAYEVYEEVDGATLDEVPGDGPPRRGVAVIGLADELPHLATAAVARDSSVSTGRWKAASTDKPHE